MREFMIFKRYFFNTISIIIVCVSILSCSSETEENTFIDDIRERNVLKVGIGVFEPWTIEASRNTGEPIAGADGYIGYEIDISKKLAMDIGVELNIIAVDWKNIITELNDRTYDIIISGLSITPERDGIIDYSIPYSHGRLEFVVNSDVDDDIDVFLDLNTTGTLILVQEGVAFVPELIENQLPNATEVTCGSTENCKERLANGDAKAWITTAPTSTIFARSEANIYRPTSNPITMGENASVSDEAFGIRMENSESIPFFNDWITTNRNYINLRYTYWFEDLNWYDEVDLSLN